MKTVSIHKRLVYMAFGFFVGVATSVLAFILWPVFLAYYFGFTEDGYEIFE